MTARIDIAHYSCSHQSLLNEESSKSIFQSIGNFFFFFPRVEPTKLDEGRFYAKVNCIVISFDKKKSLILSSVCNFVVVV